MEGTSGTGYPIFPCSGHLYRCLFPLQAPSHIRVSSYNHNSMHFHQALIAYQTKGLHCKQNKTKRNYHLDIILSQYHHHNSYNTNTVKLLLQLIRCRVPPPPHISRIHSGRGHRPPSPISSTSRPQKPAKENICPWYARLIRSPLLYCPLLGCHRPNAWVSQTRLKPNQTSPASHSLIHSHSTLSTPLPSFLPSFSHPIPSHSSTHTKHLQPLQRHLQHILLFIFLFFFLITVAVKTPYPHTLEILSLVAGNRSPV